jgi:hypothetical protein
MTIAPEVARHEAAHAVWAYITAEERGIPAAEAVTSIVVSESVPAGWMKVPGVSVVSWVETPDNISLSSQSLRADLVVCLAGIWV